MSEPNLILDVTDDSGAAIPFRADIHRANAATERAWSDSGRAALSLKPGAVKLVVRRGINYDAAAAELDIPSSRDGGVVRKSFTLKRRFVPRELGWYGGENHTHVLHDSSNAPRTFADGARMAAADGLDYIQLAYGWEPTFAWVPSVELDAQAQAASSDRVTVGWNIETPKCYMGRDHGGRDGNLHCYGHGWSVGLKDNTLGRDFFHTGPNFKIIQEINRQGGIVGCAHPVRFWFTNGNFTSNWPSELPFDFVAGAPYAAVDILNDGQPLFFESERFWHTLLNLGYKVAGTGNSDGALANNAGLGRFRTYTHIGGGVGPFSWSALAENMKAGRNVASSGPFVLFDVEGELPGAEFPADGKVRRARIKAWSAPLPGETLTAVQLIRNGEAVRAWDLRSEKARVWETQLELSDDEFAWYAVRVLSSCRDDETVARFGASVCELAVANPVYFLPKGFARPQPEPARLTLAVADAESKQPIAAKVSVIVASQPIDTIDLKPAPEHAVTVPATATLRVTADGFTATERCLYLACPELHEYCRNIGTVWPSFFTPEPYRELRRRLQNLHLTVELEEC